jgi:cytochrome b6-f complex iron-sulfur subunit
VTGVGGDAGGVPRRPVLAAGGAVAAAALLGGCGGDDAGSGSGSAAGGAGALVELSKVPVGGAVSAKSPDGKPVIVAQPSQGKAVAFSAKCTHMGCTVAPQGAKLQCPCHGSQFDALTGKVLHGPAQRPLSAFPVKVEGGTVVAG